LILFRISGIRQQGRPHPTTLRQQGLCLAETHGQQLRPVAGGWLGGLGRAAADALPQTGQLSGHGSELGSQLLNLMQFAGPVDVSNSVTRVGEVILISMFPKFLPFHLLLLAACSGLAARADQLYANGFNPSAGPTQYQGIWDQAGVGAGGSNVSVMINPPYHILGFTARSEDGYVMAEDFTVPAGQSWTINNVLLYAYQIDATTFPFQSTTLSLVSGPSPNGTSIDPAITLSASTGPGGIVARRVRLGSLTADDRRIWEILLTPSSPITLSEGDYWLRWGITALNSENFFMAPIVPRDGTGNAHRSSDGMDGTYVLLDDSGNIELPFLLDGVAVTVPGPLPLAGAACAFQWSRKLRRRLRSIA
jgi:hypothetical protein